MNDTLLPSCRFEYPVERNPYENLYLDLTYRCNMDCNYCYNPLREKFDMDLDYFAEVCRRLPRPVFFRFLGGEPTLHPRFFEFITTARRFEHHVYFSSNGIRYNDAEFMGQLKALSVSFTPGLSMDGGCSRDELYKLLNNRSCLKQKVAALENLNKYSLGRVCLSAIIVRDVNESVIGELLEMADRYADVVRYIHFRTAANIGRWIETEPYTLEELKKLVQPFFSEKQFRACCVREIYCKPEEKGGCCYRFRPTRRLQISLIEFATTQSARCPKRGKLLNERFVIQPFFENMIKTGQILEKQFGKVSAKTIM